MTRRASRRPWIAVLAAATVLLMHASSASARPTPSPDNLTADLDGRPIPLASVGKWYCHDFDYPAIHCFSDSAQLGNPKTSSMALTSVTYVTVFEFTTYQGAYMHMSQDYSMLALIGWSDRISSFQVKNSQSGAFWSDWLYSGNRYNFCCNQNVGSLGSFNDTFSSVFRN